MENEIRSENGARMEKTFPFPPCRHLYLSLPPRVKRITQSNCKSK